MILARTKLHNGFFWLLEGVIFIAVIMGIWEAVVRLGGIKAYLLPPPSAIAVAFWEARDLLFVQGVVTLREILWGFLAAVALGVPIAATIFFSKLAKRTLYPFMVALQSIPKIGLAPIIVVWLGYDMSSKITMSFLFSFFPVLVSTIGGLEATPKHLEEHFRALRATGWQTLWRLRIPAALPNFIDGCKVAMPLAVIGAIVGEFVGSNDGLGNLILLATGASNTPLTFAALFAVTALSLVLFYAVELLGRMVWWRTL